MKKSTRIDDIKDLIIRKFHVDKANEGHEYCLKTKYKNEFIKLNGENILLKEMQEKMIQQEGLCGSIKLQLAQDRIQVWVVHVTRNHPSRDRIHNRLSV